MPNESNVVQVEFVEELVEPSHEIVGTTRLGSVDASSDVVDVIERQERTRAFRRKVDAERWLLERERDKARGDWVDPALGRMVFSEWASQVEQTRLNRRPSSRARDHSLLRSLILPELGDRPLASVDPMDIRRWIAGLEERGYAAYQIVSRAFQVAVADGIITRSPYRGVKLPKIETPERRFLSPAEVEKLADTIEVRFRSLVLTGA